MSLEEKLSKISQNIEETKLKEEQSAQEKELEPIRARIKELEKERNQLDLIKGSLELKADKETGKGMKEYKTDTEQQTKKESTHLDTLIEKNKEALKTVGVENRDQLVSNPEFAEEVEVVSYKKAVEQGEGIKLSDRTLQKRLQDFGIDINAEEFSYDKAEKAIGEKLQSVESELVKEKIKTPEGRVEAVEMLAKSLEKNLPETSLNGDKDKKIASVQFGRGYDVSAIIFENKNIKFKGWNESKLWPKEIKDIEEKYGSDVAKEALKKAYENKIEVAFKSYDEKNDNIANLSKLIEGASPKKVQEAMAAFDAFEDKSREVIRNIEAKKAELKEKGIYKMSEFPLDQMGDLAGGYYSSRPENTISGQIRNSLRDATKFPPEFDYEKLKTKIEKRTEQLETLEKAFMSISTEEDMKHFADWGSPNNYKKKEGSIGKLFEDSITEHDFYPSSDHRSGINPRFKFNVTGAEKLIANAKGSFYSAEKYLEDAKKEMDALKQKASEKLFVGLDARIKKQELEQEMRNQKMQNISVETYLREIERSKNEALSLMQELIKIEAELPQDEKLTLRGGEIVVPSIGEQINKLKEDINAEKEKLTTMNQQINNYPTKPKVFGKDKWEKDLEELK